MKNYIQLKKLSSTIYADVLNRKQVMDFGIKPLWETIPRVIGPAYTVHCSAGDNLMLHAAIYRAPPGSVIIVVSDDTDYAVAGGNVCAVAQKQGIAAFIIDGVIRDIAEIRKLKFPVFARGIMPIPGAKNIVEKLNIPVNCGGVHVSPGDVVVADQEGIVLVPKAQLETVFNSALERAKKDSALTLAEWEIAHRKRIDQLLNEKGYIE